MAPALGGPISIFSELASQSEATSRGKNLIIEQRFAECRYERMPGSATELVQAPVDVLFTMGTRAARIVAETVKTTPLVVYSCDPFEHVTRLARGRGKLTGVTCLTTELSPKRLELLHDAVPTVSRVMFLHDPQAAPNAWKMTEEAAPRLGITLQQAQVGAAEEPLPELAMIAKQRPDALFVSRRRSQLLSSASAACRVCHQGPVAHDKCVPLFHRGRRSHVLRRHRIRDLYERSRAGRKNPGRHSTERVAAARGDAVRVGHQQQDGEGAQTHLPPSLLVRADEVIE